MDITPFVDALRRDLLAAAAAADPEARQAAERLTYAIDPAARLAVMEAVSQAAAEITAEMPRGGVDVRLDGRDLAFVVDSPPTTPPPIPSSATEDLEDAQVARVTLRLPESVKTRAEELAAGAGQSLNTWLVAAVRAATRDDALPADPDRSGIPVGGLADPLGRRTHRRLHGWL